MRKDTQEFIKSADRDSEAAKKLFRLSKHRNAAFRQEIQWRKLLGKRKFAPKKLKEDKEGQHYGGRS